MLGRLGSVLATVIVIGLGLLVVVGLLLGPSGQIFNISGITNLLIQLTVITIAVTIILGILNLFRVHLRRITRRSSGWVYSMALIVSAAAVLILWLVGARDINNTLLETVEVSVESALSGLVVFALVFGAYRLMRRRVTWASVLFTVVLLVILVAALPLPEVTFLKQVRDWLMDVPVSAGARGILLGIALATVVTGVRVLIGQDRSYRE
jgi:hypothetical protein